MQNEEINNAKKELANLYIILKLGNSKEVNNIFILIYKCVYYNIFI